MAAVFWAALASSLGASGQTWGDITFFVGSDLHYGYTNGTTISSQVSRGTLNAMTALPGEAYPAAAGGGTVDNPRGVLLLGDLTEAGAASDWASLTNDWGLNGEQSLPWPVYEGFGNHDCCCSDVVQAGIKVRNLLRRGVSNISTNGYHYSWDWDYLHLVCLNLFPGETPDVQGVSPRDSLNFLADDLAKNVGNSGRPVILYHHYGFDSFGLGWWSDQQRSNYLAVIQNYNVIAILTGHNHLVDSIPWCGFSTFNDGTVGKVLGPSYVISYLVVHVTQTNLTVVERLLDDSWGWGAEYDIPIAVSYQPRIISNPVSTTGTAGSAATLAVQAIGPSLNYQWFFNATNAVAGATNNLLSLPALNFSQSGSYSVLVTNAFGAAISQPATLGVSAQLAVTSSLAITLSGNVGDSLNLEYCDSLVPPSNWQPLATVTLTNTTQDYVDSAALSCGQRFYRGASSPAPLGVTQVPAVTVLGNPGDVLQLQYSDTPDPGANWLPLATLTLTSTSQVYVDTSAQGVTRYYRAIASP
jgi:hypothetical protein